jgi:hypothetical protein
MPESPVHGLQGLQPPHGLQGLQGLQAPHGLQVPQGLQGLQGLQAAACVAVRGFAMGNKPSSAMGAAAACADPVAIAPPTTNPAPINTGMNVVAKSLRLIDLTTGPPFRTL